MAEAQISGSETDERERKISPRIIVQGSGAYSCVQNEPGEYMNGVQRAAREGYAALQNGTAVDAVEAAVRVLENNEYFNAGSGSFLNSDHEVECDAMIMDGSTLNTGAVMAVRHFTNPVSLARKVMEKSSHCALCADGALEFAKKIGFSTLNNSKELTSKGREVFSEATPSSPGQDGDTVSAIAMDSKGNLACATSTGGIPGKLKGRIGDAPLVGCGGYANEYGAATSCGHGESLMKLTLAREVVYNMERGKNAEESAKNALKRMEEKESVRAYGGGVIAIDKQGNFGKALFNIEKIMWATVKDDILEFGIHQKLP